MTGSEVDVLTNNEHDVAFRAGLANGTADSGYFLRVGPAGTLQTVVLQGQSAPGVNGANFLTIQRSLNGVPGELFALGPTGQLVFGTTVQAANGFAVFDGFSFKSGGSLQLIIARGTPAPGSGGGILTVNSSPGTGSDGLFAFWGGVGGGTFASAIYVTESPVPTLTSLAPPSGIIGQAISPLTATGTNFVTGASLQFNGTSFPGTVSNGGTTLTANIPASALAATGTVSVAVINPAPGGGASNSVNFAINNPAPNLTSINPTSSLVGQAVTPLTATGTNFVTGASLLFNGTSHPGTVSNGGATITANIAASELATAGIVAVQIVNPTPGGGPSNSVNFTINNPAPTLTSIAPTAGIVGQAIPALVATGTNFVAGSMIQFNGTAFPGVVSNGGATLTAAIPATALAATGTVSVAVVNPTPGGGTSSSVNFSINNPAPTLTSISPTSGAVGQALSPLTATGTNFVTGSTLQFNGTAFPGTVSNGGTTLTANIPATSLAVTGTAPVVIINSAPGGGQSIAVNFTINNFSVTGPANPVVVTAGAPANFPINFGTQNGGQANAVTFSASGLPTATTASFNSASIPAGSASGSTTLTITTTAHGSGLPGPSGGDSMPSPQTLFWLTVFGGTTLSFLAFKLVPEGKRKPLAICVPLVLLFLSGGVLSGCTTTTNGGTGGTPAGTYMITVTATSGSAARTTTVTLTVN